MSNRKISWNNALASAKADRIPNAVTGRGIAAQRIADLKALKDKSAADRAKGIWFDPKYHKHRSPIDLAVMNAAASHFHSEEMADKISSYFKPGMTLKDIIDHFEKKNDDEKDQKA